MTRVIDMIPVMTSEEEQVFLRNLADELIDHLERTERGLTEIINAQHFDQEEYLALWSLLPAKVRTAIKRGGK